MPEPEPQPGEDQPVPQDNPEWDAFDKAVRKIAVTPKPTNPKKPDKRRER